MKNKITVRMISLAREKLLTAILHTRDYKEMELTTLIEEALWDVMSAVVGMRDTTEDGAEQWNRANEMGKYAGLEIARGVIEDFTVTIQDQKGRKVQQAIFDVQGLRKAIENLIMTKNLSETKKEATI